MSLPQVTLNTPFSLHGGKQTSFQFSHCPTFQRCGLREDTCRIWNESTSCYACCLWPAAGSPSPAREASLSLGWAVSSVASTAGWSRTSNQACSRLCTLVPEWAMSGTPSRTSDPQDISSPTSCPFSTTPGKSTYAHTHTSASCVQKHMYHAYTQMCTAT